jgi:hypothetical protein
LTNGEWEKGQKMTKAQRMPSYHKKPSMKRIGEAKSRLCLKCRKPFMSEWSGERICKRCKSSLGWRDGSGFGIKRGVVGGRK